MTCHTLRLRPALAVLAVLAATAQAALAQTSPAQTQVPVVQTPAAAPAAPAIPLELNKLEQLPQGAGCRVYFVTSNPDIHAIDQLRLDVILFGADGVISRRLAFDLGPLAPKKTAVRLFDMAGLPCDDITRVLVNDVLVCKSAALPADDEAAHAACLDRIAVSSRTKVPLVK